MFISAPQSLPHMSAETSLTGPTWRAQGGQRCARVRLYDRGSVRATAEEYSPSGPQSPPAEHAHMSKQRQAQAGTLSCGSPILDAARRMNYTDRRCACTTGTATASSPPVGADGYLQGCLSTAKRVSTIRRDLALCLPSPALLVCCLHLRGKRDGVSSIAR